MTKAMIRCRKFGLWKARPASISSAMQVVALLLAVAAILAAVIPAAVGIPLAVGILEAEGTPEEVATPAALDTKLAVIPALIPAIPEAAMAVGCPGAQVTTWKIIPNCSP
jgi:hypothetical protein